MIRIIEELSAASSHLRAALQRYITACSAAQSCFIQGNAIDSSVPQELSDCVGNELLLIDSYETSVKEAKAAISLSRNCLPAIVPISILPSEILGYIFQLVFDAQSCSFHGEDLTKPPSTDLDRLIHVCTRWRQVAIGSCALWSHIDVAPGRLFSQGFLPRAEAYVARAAHSLLDIHIVNFNERSAQSEYAAISQFLTSIATRTRSLNLKTEAGSSRSTFIDFYRSIFQACFSTCTPGIFTQLIIENDCSFIGVSAFIGTAEDTGSSEVLPLDLPPTHLEDIWLPIKVLRLTGLYPRWTSKAYHKLVDLRLVSEPGSTTITESQLVSIIAACPELHTFHFGVQVTHSLPEDASTIPIQLNDLEVLVWTSGPSTSNQLGNFLRWLSPASKPLQMSIQDFAENELGEAVPVSFENKAKEFFLRSNITHLHLRGWGIHISLVTELLGLMPSLRVLALDQTERAPRSHTSELGSSELKVHSAHLNTLYLLDSAVNLEDLQQVIQRHSIRALTLWSCMIYRNKGSKRQIGPAEVQKLLRMTCPSVQCSQSNPIQDWDYLVEW